MERFSKFMFWKKRRIVITIVFFFGYIVRSCLRANLSIAIVAMTEKKIISLESGTYESEYNWDSVMQGYILSSFFYGYLSTQLLGGYLASRIGGKQILGTGILVSSALTLFTPLVVTADGYTLLCLRAAEGFFEGLTDPCLYELYSKWAPPLERSRLLSAVFVGNYLGTIATFSLSPYLDEAFGWPSIFYCYGAFGIIWSIFFWTLVAEKPADDSRISDSELQYIKNSLYYAEMKQKVKHPWREMLTSLPVWAVIAACFCEMWGYNTMLTLLPKFMKDILDFDLSQAGFMSALPYVALALMIPTAAYAGDWLLARNKLTTVQVRKIFTVSGLIPQAVFMLAAAFFASPIESVVCLIIGTGLSGIAWSGYVVNFLDIAPQHASILQGISLTVGNTAAIISPIVAGYIVTTPTADEWRIVFYITCSLYLFGGVIYWIFAAGDVQPWAIEVDIKTIETTKKEAI